MLTKNLLYKRVHFIISFLYYLLSTNTAIGFIKKFIFTKNLLYKRVYFIISFLYYLLSL